MTLFEHVRHPHKPVNVNMLHKAEQKDAGFNAHIAVLLTKMVGTMWCAYLFTGLAIVGLFGLLGWLNPFTFLLATWISQMFLQLVFLPILSVGQNVLGRHTELMADEQFQTTQKSYADIEQMMQHLTAQDEELLKQTTELLKQTPLLEEALTLLEDHDVLLKALAATTQKGKVK